jgi:hypothetical protein
MAVAYLSRRCEDSAEFARLLSASEWGDVPAVYVEEADVIPWYVDAVPTLVVRAGETIEVYAREDAFSAIARPERREPEPKPEWRERREPERERPARKRAEEPSGFDGDAAFEGIYDASDEPAVVGCGANYETLIDGEDDADVTEATMREWEKGLAAERKEDKRREAKTSDKQLEMLMQQREAQVPAGPLGARK